jgi:glutamate decarboxylase
MAISGHSEVPRRPSNKASNDNFFPKSAPTSTFPQSQMESRVAYQLVRDELLLDGNSRQNLATFCQTWIEPEIRQLMNECMDKNLIDRDEYPQTAELELRCVRMLADLWNSPHAGDAMGCSTTGSSEASMLGGLALKRNWQKRRRGKQKRRAKPNLVCGPVQICWHKFARYFDVELRQVPCERKRFVLSPGEIISRCDENTIGVVPTLGVTFTLQYEPVKAIADALDDFEEEKGLNIPIHVDAASGGFVAPFVHPSLAWDFRIPRVKSINASGHKFGLAPLGCGWIVWREPEDLPEELMFHVKYLGGSTPTFALTFSRPGGPVASQYYNFVRLGRDGYTRVTQTCVDVGGWISDEVAKLGLFELVYNGRGGVPGCCWTIAEGKDPGFTLYDLADRLRVRGWQVPAYPMPPNRSDLTVQRVLARFGLSRDLAGMLVDDLVRAIRHFEQYPPPKSLTRQQAGGYSHA